jgi:predicted DNA-binding antitoxin AbrB/MazE fold protein
LVQVIEAIYQGGVLRPLSSIQGVVENQTVSVTIRTTDERKHPLAEIAGQMPDEDADELIRIIESEFEQVDPHAW